MAEAKKRPKHPNRKVTAEKKGKNTQKNAQDTALRNDILLIAAVGIAVLLMLSNFGLCGSLGKILSGFLFGLFGFIEYVFPILLFFGVAFFTANSNMPHIKLKIAGAIGLFLMITAFLQILMIGYEENADILSYYTDSSADHLGGGIIGGLITTLLGRLVGVVGAYTVIVILIIVFAILLTQRPLVTNAKDKSTKAYRRAKEVHSERIAAKREADELEEYDYLLSEEKKDVPLFAEPIMKNLAKDKSENPAVKKPIRSKDIPGQISFDEDELFRDNDSDEETATLVSKALNLKGLNDEKPAEIEETLTEEETASTEKVKTRRRTAASKEETENEKNAVAAEIRQNPQPPASVYKFPPVSMLKSGSGTKTSGLSAQVKATAQKLQETLNNFGVKASVVDVSIGPTVTRYELQPEMGVKVSRIVSLSDDIKLNLAAEDIRIEAPIPGKAAVGIEVPNKTNSSVMLGDIIRSEAFTNFKSKLAFAVGKDLAGEPVVSNIGKMPHLLVAGATGSGKSVCINSLILSIIYKASPEEVKFIMIDPKVVELSVYNGIPHLLIPVVTDPKKASGALNWAVAEMTDRYNKFAEYGVRDVDSYNDKIKRLMPSVGEDEEPPKAMPKIIIIIDELADLMMVAPGEVEDAIVRLTQLARAAGIHLVVATQRPSVNVITGLIKANIPSRIALSVASGIDSRVIIDMNGAEKLLGKGDMLFYPQGYQKPARVQGCFVSDEEIENIVRFLVDHKGDTSYDESIQQHIDSSASFKDQAGGRPSDDQDAYFKEAGRFIIEKDKASIGMLQRAFKIGFNRAARIMDQLCEAGVVGEEEGTKPRKILMTMEQFENYLEEN